MRIPVPSLFFWLSFFLHFIYWSLNRLLFLTSLWNFFSSSCRVFPPRSRGYFRRVHIHDKCKFASTNGSSSSGLRLTIFSLCGTEQQRYQLGSSEQVVSCPKPDALLSARCCEFGVIYSAGRSLIFLGGELPLFLAKRLFTSDVLQHFNVTSSLLFKKHPDSRNVSCIVQAFCFTVWGGTIHVHM